jgi:hypothetical protein
MRLFLKQGDRTAKELCTPGSRPAECELNLPTVGHGQTSVDDGIAAVQADDQDVRLIAKSGHHVRSDPEIRKDLLIRLQ